MIKKIRLMFVAVLVALLPPSLSAQETLSDHLDLAKISGFFFNAAPSLSIDEVSSPDMQRFFAPVDGRTIWTGKRAPASWLRFSIPSDAAASRENGWFLLVKPSFSIILDNLRLYVPRPGGGYEKFETGARVKSSPAEPHSRYFIFDLPRSAFGGGTCYLRIASSTDVLMSISLERATAFGPKEALDYLGYGLIFGIIAAMILYGFFLLLSLHYRSYIYYILYNLTVGLWIFYVQGFSKVIFGQVPGLDQAMLWLWAGQFITWGTLFTISFLDLRRGNRVLFYVLVVPAALGGLVSLAGVAGLDQFAFGLSHSLGVIVPVLVIAVAAIRLKQGFKSALYYLIAWSFLALGGVVFSMMGLKLLPVSPLTTNALPIGIALESIFLAMALASRFKNLEDENRNLEAKQAHFKELSLTDTLTGLRNRRYLTLELERAMKQADSTGEPLSVIVLDIDHFKLVNDRFGHEVGDDILVSLTHSIRSCTRPEDVACLYGGDEIVIFMPKNAKELAFRVAERVRAHFEVESMRVIRGVSFGATISSGIVQYEPGETLDALFSRADAAMYQAKSRGRNCSVLA